MGVAENVEVVRALYEAVNRDGRLDAMVAHVSSEIELETDPRHPAAGIYRGVETYRAFIEEFEEPYEHTTMEPERLFARDDRVVAFVHTRRRPYGSSIEVENRIGFVWTIRDGTIVREQVFGEREKALAAGGMTEEDAVEVAT